MKAPAEKEEKCHKLFPIRVANFETLWWTCFDADTGKVFAGMAP